ncbi:MAG TPA: 2'-5' RNA ligase family protein [Candidatus Dormibacteraeota bacterium]|nr:2'-5' RNA ligase family protein [Candidatus Dormibacteraeota bacterium]
MRQLAVLIVPPPADMVEVEQVRRRFDRLAETVPAHVTLVFPFGLGFEDAALMSHVRDVTDALPAFDLELKDVTCSWDHYLFLVVGKGADKVRDLHDRLYSGLLQPMLSEQEFTPHVTVGRFAAANECAAAMKTVDALGLQVRTRAEALRIYDLTQMPYRVTAEIPFS